MKEQKQNHSFLKSYIKGEATFGFWAVFSSILSLASSFFIISQLDVYKYGVFLLVMAFYSLMSGIFLSPLSGVVLNDVIRFTSEGREREAKRLYLESFIIRMILSFLLFAGVFFGSSIIANYYDYDMANIFKTLSALFVIGAFYDSMKMLFSVRLCFGIISFRPVLFKILKLIFVVIFLYFFQLGIKEILLSHIAAAFLATIVFVPSFIKVYNPWRKIKSASGMILAKIIRTYGKWPLISLFFGKMSGNIRPWLIKFFVNTEAVAIFGVAERLYGVVKLFFPTFTLSALIPREITDKKRAGEILMRGTKYLVGFSIVLGLVAFLFAPPLIILFFPKYKLSVSLFKLMLVLLPILSFRIMAVSFLTALRRRKFLFFMGVFEMISDLILVLVLLQFFGIWGLVFKRIALALFTAWIMFVYLVKRDGFIFPIGALFTFDKKDRVFIKKFFGQISEMLKSILKKIRGYILLTLGLIIGRPISFRNQLPNLLNFLKLKDIGAEVGVLRGRFSEIILKYSNLSLLYSIDPWKEFDEESYRDVSNVEQIKHEEKYQETVGKLKKFGGRSKIIRQTSRDASKVIGNSVLDFVYIDANHSYGGCKKDIELWWPKIKNGGVISGDDYGGKFDGVKKAVDEFVKKNNQQLFLTFETGASWYLVKNTKLTFFDKLNLYKYFLLL